MNPVKRILPGWIGTLFVSACCLGAGPLLASTAAAMGAAWLASVFNIYVLGPLVVVSVVWTSANTWRWARVVHGAAARAPSFWLTTLGGVVVVAGVFLPPLVHARQAGVTAIYLGLVVMIAGTVWSLLDQRRVARAET